MDNSDRRIGDYEVLEILGDGAQGKVWKAKRIGDGPDGMVDGEFVALKILQRGLHQDDEKIRNLKHPNIVGYRDSFVWRSTFDDLRCLVMEYLNGQTLEQLISENPLGLPWEKAKHIISDCLDGLSYAQSKGVTHRDLKPSNIFITINEEVKLIDFDIARADEGGSTTTVGWRGAFDYMSPDFRSLDNFRGDEISDVFSFGVCMYEALTGKLPLPSFGENADIGYAVRWEKNPLGGVSYEHGCLAILNMQGRELVEKSIQKDRDLRYQSFAEMKQDVDNVCNLVVEGKDNYELLSYLGSGGFGRVMVGRTQSTQKLVAVKKLDPPHHDYEKHMKRFVKEAAILESFDHEHIVKYVDFVIHKSVSGDDLFLVMELLPVMPGWSLHERLKGKKKGLDTLEAIDMFIHYLEALEYLHSHHIIHRDIKPANLYAPEQDASKAKIFDLGIVRDLRGSVSAGNVPGTLEYMAPELATAKNNRGSPKSDIFSLGLSLYRALVGRPAYPPLSRDPKQAVSDFMSRISGDEGATVDFGMEPFVTFPVLAKIVSRSIAMRPKDRFATAEEMRGHLESVKNSILGLVEDADTVYLQVEPETGATMFPFDEEDAPTFQTGTVATRAWKLSPSDKRRFAKLQKLMDEGNGAKGSWKIILLAGAATIVAASLLATPFLMKSRKQRARDDMATEVAALKTLSCNALYVEKIKGASDKSEAWAVKDSDHAEEWQSWSSQLGGYAALLPGVFSNRYGEAIHLGDSELMEDIHGEWKKLKTHAGFMSIADKHFVVLDEYMSQRHKGFLALKKLDALEKVFPRFISSESLGEAEQMAAKFMREFQKPLKDAHPDDVGLFRSKSNSISNIIAKAVYGYIEPLRMEAVNGYVWGKKDIAGKAEQTLRKMKTTAPVLLKFSSGNYQKTMEDIRKAKTGGEEMVNMAIKDIKMLSEIAKNAIDKPEEFRTAVSGLATFHGLRTVNDSLKSAWETARLNSLQAIRSLVTRHDRPQERARYLAIIAEVLGMNSADIIFADELKELQALLAKEKDSYILNIDNKTGLDLILSGEVLGVTDVRLGRGKTHQSVLIAGADIKKTTISYKGPIGYLPSQKTFAVEGGSGTNITISTLKSESIVVTLAMNPVSDPEVSVTYSLEGSGKWSNWDDATLKLSMNFGTYTVRFVRPDYMSMSRKITLMPGMKTYTIKGPSTWEESSTLKKLRVLESEWSREDKNWTLLERLLAENLNLEWAKHATALRVIKTEWLKFGPYRITNALSESERVVEDYVKWHYQVDDPELLTFRRNTQERPALALKPLPKLSGKMSDIKKINARMARLSAWMKVKGAGASEAGRQLKQAAAQLRNAGDEKLARQCEIESNILAAPDKMPEVYKDYMNTPRICSWRAHIGFYPAQSSLDTLEDMQTSILNGGSANEYDIRLTLYAAFYTWINADTEREKRYVRWVNNFLGSILGNLDSDLAVNTMVYFEKKAIAQKSVTERPCVDIIHAIAALQGLPEVSVLKTTAKKWIAANSGILPSEDFKKVKALLSL